MAAATLTVSVEAFEPTWSRRVRDWRRAMRRETEA